MSGGNYWLFMPEFEALVERIRKDERELCAKLVEDWPIESRYVVGKIQLAERRKAIAAAIRERKDGK
jgi:hypothetical protein